MEKWEGENETNIKIYNEIVRDWRLSRGMMIMD